MLIAVALGLCASFRHALLREQSFASSHHDVLVDLTLTNGRIFKNSVYASVLWQVLSRHSNSPPVSPPTLHTRRPHPVSSPTHPHVSRGPWSLSYTLLGGKLSPAHDSLGRYFPGTVRFGYCAAQTVTQRSIHQLQ